MQPYGRRVTGTDRLGVWFSLVSATLLLAGVPARAGLTHYWPFDRDASSYLADTAGGANGTAVGAAAQTTTAGQYVRGTGGLRIPHNTAAGDYVDIAVAVTPTANPATFSISAWYRYEDIGTQTTDTRNFVWETTPDYYSGFGPQYAAGVGRDAEWFFKCAPSDLNDGTGPVIDDGQWHHVVMIWNKPGNVASYYHDGVLRDSVALGARDLNLTLTPAGLHIGNHRAGDGTRNWDGYIDDFAIFDHALTGADITKIYNGERFDTLDNPPVRAARVAISAVPAYTVTQQTTGFGVTFRNANTGDHELYVRGERPRQTDGVIIGVANDGGDSIVQVGGDLTETTSDARFNNGMAFVTCDQSAGTEKNFNLAFAHFPFQRGWIGAHVNAAGTVLAGPNLPVGTTVSKLSALARRGPGHYVVHLPINGASDEGLLFVVGGENDDNYTCAGVFDDAANLDVVAGNAALGDWHVHIRHWNQNDTSDVGEDGAFSFVYLPYRSANLIGGRIRDDDRNNPGTLTTVKAAGTWTIANPSTGTYTIQIPNGLGGYYSDADGILLAASYSILEDISSGNNQDPVDGNVVSWTYAANTFTLKSYDAPAATAQDSEELVFAFVRYNTPLDPPPPPQGSVFIFQ